MRGTLVGKARSGVLVWYKLSELQGDSPFHRCCICPEYIFLFSFIEKLANFDCF